MTSHAINDDIQFPVLMDSAMHTAWNTSLSKFGRALIQFKLHSTYLHPVGSITDFDALVADYHRAQLSKSKDYVGKPGPIVKKATSAELLAARALIAANDAVSLSTGGIHASPCSLSASSACLIAHVSDSD